jgi:hypothetical protein
VASDLAQQASCFHLNQGKLYVLEKLDVPIYHSGCFILQLMHNVEICSTKHGSAKLDVLE